MRRRMMGGAVGEMFDSNCAFLINRPLSKEYFNIYGSRDGINFTKFRSIADLNTIDYDVNALPHLNAYVIKNMPLEINSGKKNCSTSGVSTSINIIGSLTNCKNFLIFSDENNFTDYKMHTYIIPLEGSPSSPYVVIYNCGFLGVAGGGSSTTTPTIIFHDMNGRIYQTSDSFDSFSIVGPNSPTSGFNKNNIITALYEQDTFGIVSGKFIYTQLGNTAVYSDNNNANFHYYIGIIPLFPDTTTGSFMVCENNLTYLTTMYRYDQTGSTTTTGTKFKLDYYAGSSSVITRDHNNMWMYHYNNFLDWYRLTIYETSLEPKTRCLLKNSDGTTTSMAKKTYYLLNNPGQALNYTWLSYDGQLLMSSDSGNTFVATNVEGSPSLAVGGYTTVTCNRNTVLES